ncbi:MAG TPA: glycosyltransferase family 1 protein, partial [Pirellulaceae bacterium]
NDLRLFCLDDRTSTAFRAESANVVRQVLWPRQRWLSFPLSLSRAIAASDVDLVHATFVPPLRCDKPLVVTIHDVCLHTHRELYPWTVRWRFSQLVFKRLHGCDQIICPTRTSRDVLLSNFRVAEERVTVIPHGINPQFHPLDSDSREPILRRHGIHAPYLLYSGNLRVGNKNLIRALEAFHAFRRETGESTKLVFTGRRSWQARELDQALDRLHLRSSVIETGWVPPEDLPAIYSGATMLLFPTLCEGFGLPALEAMACGTPVVTSNCSCMPEVTGGAALLVDPRSVTEITHAITRLFGDTGLRESLRTRGLDWIRQFTWGRAARDTMRVYAQALSSRI